MITTTILFYCAVTLGVYLFLVNLERRTTGKAPSQFTAVVLSLLWLPAAVVVLCLLVWGLLYWLVARISTWTAI